MQKTCDHLSLRADLKSRICEVQKCDGVDNCPLDPGEAVAWDERDCIPYENITFQPPLPPRATTTTPLPPGELSTGLGKKVVPRLRELAPCSQRESGGGIHAT